MTMNVHCAPASSGRYLLGQPHLHIAHPKWRFGRNNAPFVEEACATPCPHPSARGNVHGTWILIVPSISPRAPGQGHALQAPAISEDGSPPPSEISGKVLQSWRGGIGSDDAPTTDCRTSENKGCTVQATVYAQSTPAQKQQY